MGDDLTSSLTNLRSPSNQPFSTQAGPRSRRLAGLPGDKPMMEPLDRPHVAFLAIDADFGPGPEDAAMVRMVGIVIVGHQSAVRRIDRVQVARIASSLREARG